MTQKVKQIIGRKRSRDSDDDDHDERESKLEPPPRNTKARKLSEVAFWTKFQKVRKEQNAIEAMVEAAKVAHAYDVRNQLDRYPPNADPETLALLEGRLSLCDTPGWAGGDIEAVQRFLNSGHPGMRTPVFNTVPDFSWAGDEVDDFRLFVGAADDQDWLRDVAMT